jgi:hypothetical protein
MLVRRHRARIERVAKALLAKTTLSAKQLDKLVGRSVDDVKVNAPYLLAMRGADEPASSSHHHRGRVDRGRYCADEPLDACGERHRRKQQAHHADEPLERHYCDMRRDRTGLGDTVSTTSSNAAADKIAVRRPGCPRKLPRAARSRACPCVRGRAQLPDTGPGDAEFTNANFANLGKRERRASQSRVRVVDPWFF